MNGIKEGDIISVRHYSGLSPFKSIVMSISEDVVTVKLTKDFAVMNFLEGDPVVLCYEINDEVNVYGCNIEKIHIREDIVELSIDKVDLNAVNQRYHERFPVSLYADICAKDSRKKQLATIKDLSYYGMLIYSKADVQLNEQLEVDIYMEKTIIFLKGNVVRKVQKENFIEYGLGIVYEDGHSLNFMKDYIKRLKEDQEELIRRLKNK